MNDLIRTLPDNWETQLEQLMLKHQRNLCRPREYLASPCKDENPDVVCLNMRAARFYLYYAYTQLGINAWAPQAYLPALLCDMTPGERAKAMQFGLGLVDDSKRFNVCGRVITDGMKQEALRAAQLGMPIRVFDHILYQDAYFAWIYDSYTDEMLYQNLYGKRFIKCNNKTFIPYC